MGKKFAGPSAQRRVGIPSGWSCCQNDPSFLLYRDPSAPETSHRWRFEVTLATLWRSKARFFRFLDAPARHRKNNDFSTRPKINKIRTGPRSNRVACWPSSLHCCLTLHFTFCTSPFCTSPFCRSLFCKPTAVVFLFLLFFCRLSTLTVVN